MLQDFSKAEQYSTDDEKFHAAQRHDLKRLAVCALVHLVMAFKQDNMEPIISRFVEDKRNVIKDQLRSIEDEETKKRLESFFAQLTKERNLAPNHDTYIKIMQGTLKVKPIETMLILNKMIKNPIYSQDHNIKVNTLEVIRNEGGADIYAGVKFR